MLRRSLPAIMLFLLFVSLVALPAAHAQEPPGVIQAVLAALSEREGVPVQLADLDDWRWSQRTFEDTSLGCPQPGEDYEDRPTSGYRFIIVYGGATYDYRVTTNGATVVLCQPSQTTPTPTPPPTTRTPVPTVLPPTATPLGEEVCPGLMPSRLGVGMAAQPAGEALPRSIRGAPKRASTIIGQIAPGASASIVAGPRCAEGLVWWQVDYNTLIGWMPEGQNDVYWLQRAAAPGPSPAPGDTTPTPAPAATLDLPGPRQPITADTAAALTPLVDLPLDEPATALAWSSDGGTLAAAGPSGVWLFDAEQFAAAPRLLRTGETTVYDVAFSPVPGDDRMATAHDDGTIRLWDVATGGQRTVLRGHERPARAITFSEDGTLLASGDGVREGATAPASILLWDLATEAQTVRLEGHTARIRALAFSGDGTLLASGGDDHTVRLWDLVSATLLGVLEGHTAPVTDVAFLPGEVTLVSASEDGTVRLWDVASGGSLVLEEAGAPVEGLALAPGGDLLAIGGQLGDETGALRLWRVSDQTPIAALADAAPAGGTVPDALFHDAGRVLAFIAATAERSSIRLWGVLGSAPASAE